MPGAQVHGDRVALRVLRRLAVVRHVRADERAGGEPHAHVLVEAEVDDLLDHAGNAVLAARAVRLEPHVLGADHRERRPAHVARRLAAQREVAERQRRVAAVAGPRGHGHEVRRAEEVGDERRLGLLVELLRRRALLDPPVAHDRDAVAHRQRLVLVVGDVDERDLELLLDPLQLDLEVDPQPRVERAERLVEQQHRRLQHERAGERDPLLLAAGELRGAALAEALQSHEVHRLVHAPAPVGLADPLVAQPERDVVRDRLVREERVALEDRVDAPLVRRRARHVDAVEQDRAGVGPLEPGDQAQRRRLAAARRAEHREELARAGRAGRSRRRRRRRRSS